MNFRKPLGCIFLETFLIDFDKNNEVNFTLFCQNEWVGCSRTAGHFQTTVFYLLIEKLHHGTQKLELFVLFLPR